jgi:hypothetical protein
MRHETIIENNRGGKEKGEKEFIPKGWLAALV